MNDQNDTTHEISLKVNGVSRSGACPARTSLADFLRDELGLTGTHLGCEHGVCGACTILVDGRAVRGCLMLAVQARGREVRTVEGLAAEDGTLSALQQAFTEHHAVQCGFCTPGILMTLAEVLAETPEIDERAMREALSGNLCRCTGYQNIVDAALEAARTAGIARAGDRP